MGTRWVTRASDSDHMFERDFDASRISSRVFNCLHRCFVVSVSKKPARGPVFVDIVNLTTQARRSDGQPWQSGELTDCS